MTAAFIIPEPLINCLTRVTSVTVLTGAGISAESKVPTFRDAQSGLWARYDPQRLASAEGYAADPKLVWEWYEWRRELVAKAEPKSIRKKHRLRHARITHCVARPEKYFLRS